MAFPYRAVNWPNSHAAVGPGQALGRYEEGPPDLSGRPRSKVKWPESQFSGAEGGAITGGWVTTAAACSSSIAGSGSGRRSSASFSTSSTEPTGTIRNPDFTLSG